MARASSKLSKRRVFERILRARCADAFPADAARAAEYNAAIVRAATRDVRGTGWSWREPFASRARAIAARLHFDYDACAFEAGRFAAVCGRPMAFRAILRAFERPRDAVVGYVVGFDPHATDVVASDVVAAALADAALARFRAWAVRHMAAHDYAAI